MLQDNYCQLDLAPFGTHFSYREHGTSTLPARQELATRQLIQKVKKMKTKTMSRMGSTENALLVVTILAVLLVVGIGFQLSPNSFRARPSKQEPEKVEENKPKGPPPPPVIMTDEEIERQARRDEVKAQMERNDWREQNSLHWDIEKGRYKTNGELEDEKKAKEQEISSGRHRLWEESENVKNPSIEAPYIVNANITKSEIGLAADVVTPEPNIDEDVVVTGEMDDMIEKMLAYESKGVRLSKGRRMPLRTWTSTNGEHTMEAALVGADHERMVVRLKVNGKEKDFSWDKFHANDIVYLKRYCFDAVQKRKVEAYKQRNLKLYLAARSRRNTRKSEMRSAVNANIAQARHLTNKHNYDYQYNSVYRNAWERTQNRKASVARAYAFGAGFKTGRHYWVPGYQNANGTYIPGHFR